MISREGVFLLLENCSKAFWHIVHLCPLTSSLLHRSCIGVWQLNYPSDCLDTECLLLKCSSFLICWCWRAYLYLFPCLRAENCVHASEWLTLKNCRSKCVFHHADHSSLAKIMKRTVQLAFGSHVMLLPSASCFEMGKRKTIKSKNIKTFYLFLVTVLAVFLSSWIVHHRDGKYIQTTTGSWLKSFLSWLCCI